MILTEIGWTAIIRTISQIATAGVAITAVSLLFYALAFNLSDRVARSFALILACAVFIYTAETLAVVSTSGAVIEYWLRLKWLGLVFLPATYLHFSDALLTLTGKLSKGKRRFAVKFIYLLSFLLLILIPLRILIGDLIIDTGPSPFLERTLYTNLFALYYAGVMLMAAYNLARAVKRSITTTSRRRLIYLFAGATAPAMASYLFLFHGTGIFNQYPALFWGLATLGAVIVASFLVVMAYSVAFFGVTWTDRVVKSRLFKWLLRGPFVASVTLGMTTIVRRIGEFFGDPYVAYVPLIMVATILILEYLLTILVPFFEKWLFYGSDKEDLSLIRSLEDHLLTRKDLDQFLEVVTATICDRMQVPGSFIAVFNNDEVEYVIKAGDSKVFDLIEWNEVAIVTKQYENTTEHSYFRWGEFILLPLINGNHQNGDTLLGLCGFMWGPDIDMDEEQIDAVHLLVERASLALRDRKTQQQVLNSLKELQPQVNFIQQLRAVSRYDRMKIFTEQEDLPVEDFTVWVKDALVHFWGGPKLTESPLMEMKLVKNALKEYDGNYANALRGILRNAIDQLKPEGDRKFTGEWILYNILELKFIEGKKVREIASRLAMSEADLYRKQRIAIEAVAKVIIELELNSQNESSEIG